MARLRDIGLGKTHIQHVLDTFLNPHLDLQSCAPTYYLAEKVEIATAPTIVCTEYFLIFLFVFIFIFLVNTPFRQPIRCRLAALLYTIRNHQHMLHCTYLTQRLMNILFGIGAIMRGLLMSHTTLTDG